ncbi:MAG: VPLPA-CTERM sorting domain-containing protein [Thermodesulfobacteriota bacterium]|nr:VPLPA-CTERM sorting domain-containing protein [Thermodesulfobacteriota bacterium]
MRKYACGFLLLFIIMISTSVTHASLVTPPDLSPGDQFHWAFITHATIRGFYGDIANYNGFVQMQAEDDLSLTKELGIDWYAVASTATVDAKDNVNVTGPVYRLDGVKIADDEDDLWDGSLLAFLNINQRGHERNHNVWTGTRPNGLKGNYLGLANPTIGVQPEDTQNWIEFGQYAKFTYFPMYAISEVQEVPALVPVPGAVWLLGSGLIGLVGIRRKFNK